MSKDKNKTNVTYDLTKPEIIKEGQEKGYITIKENKIYYNALNFSDNYADPEEKVRAGLFVDLIDRFDYENSKDVFELEKYHKVGHPDKKTDLKIDIILKKDKTPFAIFELKSPEEYESDMDSSIETQLFNAAAIEDKRGKYLKYLIYYTRFYENGELKEKVITIDYVKYKTYQEWNDDGRPNLLMIPKKYGIVRKPIFIKGGKPALDTSIKKDQLDRIARDLHNVEGCSKLGVLKDR